jgi:hypothetical protein
VLPYEEDAVALNPHLLGSGDADLVTSGIIEVVRTTD